MKNKAVVLTRVANVFCSFALALVQLPGVNASTLQQFRSMRVDDFIDMKAL